MNVYSDIHSFFSYVGLLVSLIRYLLEHPEYMEGVSMSQFSFQIPRPLQKNYVKRKSLTDAARDADNLQIPEADLIPADSM